MKKLFLLRMKLSPIRREITSCQKEITNVMVLLNNTKGSKEALERHINDNVALESYGTKKDEPLTQDLPKASSTSSNNVPAAKQELKQLMQ